MPGDDPIVVTGGGSVEAEYSDKYTDQPNKGKKKVKNKDVDLAWLEINGERVRELNVDDRIVVHTK